MTLVMSTSLKVVSIAAVFCTSFRRRAMVWRSRVIFTRSSRAASSAGEGAADLHGRGRLVDRGRRGRRLLDCGQHVALGDAAILAGARHGRSIDTALGGQFAHRRRERRVCGRRLGRCGSRRRCGRRRGRWSCCRLRSGGRRSGRCRAILDLAEQRADRDRVAVLGRDLAEHAGRGRRHLDGDLVGLELHQGLVDRDGFAGLLEPAADGGLGHGLAERGNANFSHGLFPLRHGRARPGHPRL